MNVCFSCLHLSGEPDEHKIERKRKGNQVDPSSVNRKTSRIASFSSTPTRPPCTLPFPLFLFFLCFGHGTAHHAIRARDPCDPKICSSQEPPVQFPFRLKPYQPANCSYNQEFDLSCDDHGNTLLSLPKTSHPLFVKSIDYAKQSVLMQDPNECLPLLLANLNLSSFSYQRVYNNDPDGYPPSNYNSLFKCPPPERTQHDPGGPPDPTVREIPYDAHLVWDKPDCGQCTKQPLLSREESWALFLFLVGLIGFGYVLNKKRRDKAFQLKIKSFLHDYEALKPTHYSYNDIKRITNDFEEKLGQGAYGTVYKGKLLNEIFVAVKMLDNSFGNGEEFINEVSTMGRIHHVNMVRMVGFCADGFLRALVYEFLPNESLEKFVFQGDDTLDPFLSWERLHDITLGVAKGVEYLHRGRDHKILHFDIKPHNILLDDNFNLKIADFSLAKLCSKEQSAVSMTAARGTMGYIAPEVFSRNFGSVSSKLDVYSVGMLLLEMVGGRKNVYVNAKNMSQMYFPTYPADRPPMKVVVQMLEGDECPLMPKNPFVSSSSGDATTMRGRLRNKELEVIAE
ncbi:hypothetical protein ACJRO7_001419 [Eucalyptus globulus]|uniref:non-specific serine/threonine protein kinase n=1 Tax=Eucalyptus globulus TaxID=34317 RepID=A0ABD3LUG5_EUCGL